MQAPGMKTRHTFTLTGPTTEAVQAHALARPGVSVHRTAVALVLLALDVARRDPQLLDDALRRTHRSRKLEPLADTST